MTKPFNATVDATLGAWQFHRDNCATCGKYDDDRPNTAASLCWTGSRLFKEWKAATQQQTHTRKLETFDLFDGRPTTKRARESMRHKS